MELIDRDQRMIERRIKAAKFPSTKSLDGSVQNSVSFCYFII